MVEGVFVLFDTTAPFACFSGIFFFDSVGSCGLEVAVVEFCTINAVEEVADITLGVEVAIRAVLVAVICMVEDALADVAFTIDDAPPDAAKFPGFAKAERREPHVLPDAAGIAYAVAHMRVCVSLEVGSTPPSVCCRPVK